LILSRWIARFTGLLPADPTEAARQDMLFEAAQELCGGFMNVNFIVNAMDAGAEDFAAAKQKYLGNWAAAAANFAAQLSADFFGGARPLFADFHIWHA
jgi:hypothetical protein